jgi:hypothetical protein
MNSGLNGQKYSQSFRINWVALANDNLTQLSVVYTPSLMSVISLEYNEMSYILVLLR